VLLGMGVMNYPENVVRARQAGLSAVRIRDVRKVVDISAAWLKEARNPVLYRLLELLPSEIAAS